MNKIKLKWIWLDNVYCKLVCHTELERHRWRT